MLGLIFFFREQSFTLSADSRTRSTGFRHLFQSPIPFVALGMHRFGDGAANEAPHL